MIFNLKNEDGLLAERLRPNYKSTQLLLGSAKRIWERDFKQWLNSHKFHIILWGPPGSGKTTLAKILCEASGLKSVFLSAVRDGSKEIRSAVQNNPHCILFIDEIHRLNRTQQDVLLPILEHSEAWVIGATTEPPQTEMSPAFLSRIRNIYVAPLTENDIKTALVNGYDFIKNKEDKIFSSYLTEERIYKKVIPKITQLSGGDLRFSLNLFENILFSEDENEEESIFKNTLKAYTNKNHHDFISAMIKSMRGSDPDAALFYAITALDLGEDPLFILRRCVIFACEDIGNADPQALNLANNAFRAVECVGMPEGRIPLAQCVTYLASTHKSNKVYLAIDKVREWRKKAEIQGLSIAPPTELTLKGKENYKYPHNYTNSFVYFDYLPKGISKIKIEDKSPAYLPSDVGTEQKLKARLAELWKKQNKTN